MKLTPWSNLVKPERGTLGPLAATSLIVGLGLTLVWQLTDQREARVDRFGASMAGSVAELCVEPLLKQDRMHLGVLSNRIAAVAEVSGVGIFTLDDQVLALSGKLGPPRYAHPISFDDSVVGYVRISVDASAFADGLGHTGRVLGILLVLVMLIATMRYTGVGPLGWPLFGWFSRDIYAATILRCLGIDHERLTFRFQGRQYRLTDVHGEIVNHILA